MFWPRNRKLRLINPWSLPNAIKLPENDTAPMMPPSTPSVSTAGPCAVAREQLDGGDGGGRAAAHAVVERDHLRHVRHRDAPARDPGRDAADGYRDRHQRVVAHARRQERDQRGDDHADAGPDDAAARRDRRAHALQTENEQRGRDEVARLNRRGGAVACPSAFALAALEHLEHALRDGVAADGVAGREHDADERDRELERRSARPIATIAPTSTMPCTKLEPDISGVCKITGTRAMTS